MNSFLAIVFFAGLSLGFVKAYIPVIAEIISHNADFVAFIVGILTLSWPIFGVLSGSLLDKFNRIAVLKVSYILYGIISIGIGFLFLFKFNQLVLLTIFALISGICVVIHENVYMTIPKDLCGANELSSINSKILFVDFFAGSFLGATFSAWFSSSNLMVYSFFIVAIGVFLAGLFCLQLKHVKSTSSLQSVSIKEAMWFLLKNQTLFSISLLALLLSITFGIYQALLMQFVVSKLFLGLPLKYFGYTYALYGIGIVIGSFFASYVYKIFGIIVCILADILGTAGLLIIPVLSHNLFVVYGWILFAGCAVSLWFVSTSTIRQKITPNHMLGKVNGVYRIFAYCGMPLGAFIAGFAVDHIELKLFLIISGAVILIMSTIILIASRGVLLYQNKS